MNLPSSSSHLKWLMTQKIKGCWSQQLARLGNRVCRMYVNIDKTRSRHKMETERYYYICPRPQLANDISARRDSAL